MKILFVCVAVLLVTGTQLVAADGDLVVNGNVAIGTAITGLGSANKHLTVTAADTGEIPAVELVGRTGSENGSNGRIDFFNAMATTLTEPGARIAACRSNSGHDSAYLTFSTRPTNGDSLYERMRIDNGGNVGIGTTSPSYPLHVNGATYCTSGAWVGSDLRLKTNIQPISNAVSLVQGLQGVRFEWKRDEFKDRNLDGGKRIGLIAQDVEKVMPELVKTDREGYKAVSYEKLTVVLLEAVKELKAEIDRLKGR